jgi:hypothetical protein
MPQRLKAGYQLIVLLSSLNKAAPVNSGLPT